MAAKGLLWSGPLEREGRAVGSGTQPSRPWLGRLGARRSAGLVFKAGVRRAEALRGSRVEWGHSVCMYHRRSSAHRHGQHCPDLFPWLQHGNLSLEQGESSHQPEGSPFQLPIFSLLAAGALGCRGPGRESLAHWNWLLLVCNRL